MQRVSHTLFKTLFYSAVCNMQLGYAHPHTPFYDQEINKTTIITTGQTSLKEDVLLEDQLDTTDESNLDLIDNGNITFRAESAGGIIINGPGFGSTGILHNDATGALSSSLIVDTDITNSTISSAKLADATLVALAAYNTSGLLTQTASNTFTGRTIVGTANQVIVTNGDGVAGNPTLALPQDIATTSSPTFANTTCSNSIILEDPGVGTETITLQAPTLIGSYSLTLPDSDGDADQVLATDGAGNLSWVSAAGSAQVSTRMEWATVQGSNGALISSSQTVASVRNSAGVYTLTITPGLNVEPTVLVTIRQTGALGTASQATVETLSNTPTSTVVRIRFFTVALIPLALDSDFSVLFIGTQ